MPQTKIRGNTQIISGTVPRQAIDTTTTGQAAITRMIAEARLTMSQTGVDSGTGVVTIDLAASGVTPGSYTKVTVDAYGRVTLGGSLEASDVPAGSANYIQNQTAISQSASFRVTGSGQLGSGLILDSAVPGVVVNTLYNNASTLLWNGSAVITSSGTQTITGSKTFTSDVVATSISGLDHIDFWTGRTPGTIPAEVQGRIFWNPDNRTLELMHGNGVIQSLGEELYIYARNTTGATIEDGTVVVIAGAQGDRAIVALAQATTTVSNKFIYAVATEHILDGAIGKATRFGIIRDIAIPNGDWVADDKLSLSTTAGAMTRDVVAKPNTQLSLGYVLRTTGSGVGKKADVFFDPHLNDSLSKATDVNFTGIANGDLIVYESANSYWKNMPTTAYGRGFLGLDDPTAALNYTNALGIAPIQDLAFLSGWSDGKNIDVSYNSTNRTVTLTHASGFIRGYWKGRPVTLVSPWTSSAHAAGFAVYYLYSSDGATFNWSTTPFDFRHMHIASVRYLSSITAGIREPHGLMDPDTHEDLHVNIGTYAKAGGLLTSGTYAIGAPESDANNTPGIDSITVKDEDCESVITALPQGTYTHVYIDASNNSVFSTGNAFPFSYTPAGYINYFPSGVQTQGTQPAYYCVYAIAAPTTSDAQSQAYRWMWMQSQAVYTTLAQAQAESVSSLRLGDLQSLFQECVPRIKLIYRSSASYTTTGKVRLEDFAYVTKTLNIAATGSLTSSWSTITGIPTPIQAFADLVPNADLLPYFNSATTATTTTLSAFARTLLDDANASSFFNTLGVSAFVQTIFNDVDAATVRATIGAGTSSFDGVFSSLTGIPSNISALGSLANSVGMLYNNGSGSLSWVESLAVASGTKSFTDFGQVSGSNPTIKTTANNIGIGFSDNRGVNWRGGFVTNDTHFGFSQEANDSFTDLKIFVIYQAGANAYQLNPTGTLRHRFLGGIISFGDVTIAGGTFTLGSATGVLVSSSGVVSVASAGFNALSLTTAGADQVPYYTGTTTASTMTVTSFARTLLDDTTASAVLTTLGVSAFVQTILNDTDASTVRATISASALTHAAAHYAGGADEIAGQSLAGLQYTDTPRFHAVNAARAGSDGVGNGPFIRVMDSWASPTMQWIMQLGAGGNLAFWNYASSTWTQRWNFLADGALRQGTVERISSTGGFRAEDITATYLKVTAPNSGTSYVNMDFNGGTLGNRRMSFRWDDVGDRLEIFTSNDDGTSRSARVRIPRSDASSILMYYGLTLASGNLNITSLTASSLVATDSGKNLVSYTLVANDIPNLDWAKITTGKPTTLGGYGITNATAKSSATASINVTANTWYRVATSTVGVGRNSGEFYMRWSVAGSHGAVRFNASNHYNRNESVSIQQLEYGKYVSGITKARVVYYSGVYVGEYCHLEVMFDTSLTGVSVTQEIREALGWTLTGVGDAGSIPANYTSYEYTFVPLYNIVAGTYAKVTINQEGRVTSGGSLSAGDLPGVVGTLAGLANAQGVLYNSGAGVLSWSPALPISSYSLIGFSNFGASSTSAYAYGISSNNGIGFLDARGLSWRGGFVTTDAYFGIMQDAGVTTSFKPYIIAGGDNSTYYKMDPLDTSFRHYLTGATRVSTRMTIGSVANKTGAIDVDTGSIRNYVNQNVASLIHFTGINGTRQFIDTAGHRWVGKCILENSIRLPYISTAVSRFGGGSLLNEATQLVEFEGSSYTSFNVSSGASFTVEMQVYFNTALTTVFFDFGPSTTGIRATYVPGTGLQVIIQNVTRTFAWSPTGATWYHLAVIRNGTDLFCSVNGVQIGSNYTSNESITVTRNPIIAAGSSTVGDYFGCLEGRVNEFRYIKSAISTTPTFTAPTSIYDYGSFSQPGNVSGVVNGPGLVMTSDGFGNGTFQPPRRTTILMFALADDVINTSIYFHSWIGAQGGPRSGSVLGMVNAGSCSPIVVPFSGRITSATMYAGRLAVNAASVTYPCFLQTVLNTVTSGAEHNPQRTSSNINFSVRYAPVGTMATVDCVANVNNINQQVTAGDCLALKFVNGSATNLIGMAGNVFVSLTLEEVM